ncbi:MAG: helix-turn-helix transcriptional regulator [Thermodesulfovibrionales bacterium]|nr:helix-turn-helix transcriptional regulator [Thermodesulfovibrionales bacterium]
MIRLDSWYNLNKKPSLIMTEKKHNLNEFLLNSMPVGVIVFNHTLDIVFCNKHAKFFLNRFTLPVEIATINTRIFNAIKSVNLAEAFPGEVLFSKTYETSPSTWIFRFIIRETPEPFVAVFIMEDTISNSLDLNRIRQQHSLTRREIDVLRRVLDGLKNLEIAENLEIGEQTVKDHLSNIYLKLGVENRFALMRSLLHCSNSYHDF